MKYCLPDFPVQRVGPFAFGTYGLGNLLLIWSRAFSYARQHGCGMVWPEWGALQLGAWLRRDRDKRLYGRLFVKPADYITRSEASRMLHFAEANAPAFLHAKDNSVLVFAGLGSEFSTLPQHRMDLWRELVRIGKPDLEAARKRGRGSIGFCLRLGDFKRLGWSTPVSWFADRLTELRRSLPTHPVLIFSDGSDEELADLLTQPFVTRAPEADPLSTIAMISGLDGMICTGGSTFYRWGAFLGSVTTMPNAGDQWHTELWHQVTSSAFPVVGSSPPSDDTWAAFTGAIRGRCGATAGIE